MRSKQLGQRNGMRIEEKIQNGLESALKEGQLGKIYTHMDGHA